MIFKLLVLMLVIFFVYLVFFKKGREEKINKKDNKEIETMTQCPKCGTFISKDEAILSNGKYYCSKECLR